MNNNRVIDAVSSDFSGSVEAYTQAVDYCRTQGDDVNACVCLGCMSWILFRTGDWKRALEVSREVLAEDTIIGPAPTLR